MMNYFSSKKKWMAYLVLLTFVFTCIVPTNIVGGNSEAWADTAASAPMVATADNTIVSAGVESGITFKMFDYDKNINWSDGTSGTFRPIASYFTFRGSEGNVSEGEQPKMPTFVQYTYQEGETVKEVKTNINNLYDEDGFTLNHATVERTLDENGYPVLSLTRKADGTSRVDPGLSYENRKLDYLFKTGDHAVSAYAANNTLLKYNETTGEYSYNSKDNAVDFDCNTGEFLVRNYKERSKSTTNYANSSPYWDFLPFTYSTTGSADKINEDKTATNEKDSEGNVIMQEAVGYGLPYNYDVNPNYWYGMTMETQFRQPASGQVENGSDMVFSFSGDDDVWVFIDNVLVLDLGGTHGVVTGSINFADGTVTQHIDWAGDNGTKQYHWNATKNQTEACVTTGENACSDCGGYVKSYPPTTIKACFEAAGQANTVNWKDDTDTFADNTKHTLKFFYLERGSGSANCAMNFNLQVSETAKTVEKVWDDDNNRDGIRPDSVQVQLFKDGQPTTGSAITLDVTNNWAYTWTELEKYDDNGNEINYTVKELEQDSSDKYLEAGAAFNEDYNVTYATDTTTGKVTVTNTHEPEKISISGIKHWIDEDNKNNTRPESIKVNLTGMVDGQQVSTTSQAITIADDWQFAFNDLPKYHEGEVGKEINYVITEDYVEGYQTFYDSDSYDITNIYNDSPVLFMDLPVTKIWQDDDNKAGIRPGSIELQLKQNGVATGSAITLEPDADGNWQYTFEKLPRYDKDGKSYVYSVVEKAVEGYLSTVVARADSITIYNKPYNGEVGTFTVSKTVDDPDSIATDDTRFGFELEVSAEMKDWDSLIVYNRNKLLDEVDEAESAKATAQGNFEKAKELFAGKAHVYSTGSAYLFVMDVTTPQAYEYAMIDENGTLYSKTTESAYDFWGTATEYDDSEKVGLLAKFFEAIQKLAKNFSALPNPGTVLNALFDGKGTDNDIAVEFGQDDAQALLNSANALLKAENDVDAAKAALKDFDDNVPTTPSAIKLTMTPKNGNGIVKELKPEVAVGETNFFDATNKVYRIPFELAHGEEYKFSIEATTGASIKYQVTEIDTKGANETRVNNLVNTRTGIQMLTKEVEHALWAFTNIFKQQGGGGGGETGATIDRTVKKVWNDNNNPDRPSAITVNLLCNGEIHDTVTLNASNGWSHDWTGLENGPLWSVREVNVADGYTASVSRSGNTFIITNTLTTTSTIPDETIPDENVPTGSVEPGVPLDEPEIPLGDAPATGDSANAVPFMALLLAAIIGLAITRRKFN